MVTRLFAGLAPITLALLAMLFAAVAVAAPMAQSRPGIGTMDHVPAATVLIPYFEVDLDDASGRSTVISLSNTSATAILANVTLWSDTASPVTWFNIYLTGYDVSNFNLRDVLNGNRPASASDGQDPADTISNQGQFSQDINYASCSGILPYAAMSATEVADMQAMLTGRAIASSPGLCFGTNRGDNVARGYVTIDTMAACGSVFPGFPGYFGGGGLATQQNTLLADYMLIDPSQGAMAFENAVAIEADATDPETSVPGEYTFYGRYVGWTALDLREPLATTWAVQGDYGSSQAIVWRDPKNASLTQARFTCGGAPAYAPMGHESVSAFDGAGELSVATASSVAAVATQLAPMDSASMGIPAQKMGWMYMNLNSTVAPSGANPPEDPAAAQSHITVLRTHKGVPALSTGAMATPLDSATRASHTIIGN